MPAFEFRFSHFSSRVAVALPATLFRHLHRFPLPFLISLPSSPAMASSWLSHFRPNLSLERNSWPVQLWKSFAAP